MCFPKIVFASVLLLFVSLDFGSVAFGQQCTIDPITGQRTCQPIRKVLSTSAAVAGKTLSAVGDAITPNPFASPQQTFTILDLPILEPIPVVNYPVSVPTPIITYTNPPAVVTSYPVVSTSTGWSKSWHKVTGQPVRNVGRRWLGR